MSLSFIFDEYVQPAQRAFIMAIESPGVKPYEQFHCSFIIKEPKELVYLGTVLDEMPTMCDTDKYKFDYKMEWSEEYGGQRITYTYKGQNGPNQSTT